MKPRIAAKVAKVASIPELESQFMALRLRETSMIVSTANACFLLLYSAVALVTDQLAARPENFEILITLRLTTIVLALLFFIVESRKPSLASAWVTMMQMVVNGTFAFLLHDGFEAGLHQRAIIPALGFMSNSIFFIIGSPLNPRMLWVPVSINMAMATVAVSSDFGSYAKFLIVLAGAYMFCCGFHAVMTSWTARAASNELNARLKVAPHELVRRAMARSEALEEQLKPQLRWCVCLASDWRGYQKISRTAKPEDLADALTGYYNACRQLLERSFPSGNYFSDWIADELLIYFLTEREPPDPLLCIDVIEFSRQLIAMKNEFAARTGLPRGIDIGLASGLATIGLSGMASNRKVIAVGDVPVRSRKMQSLGKALRTACGEEDRIIYSDALLDDTVVPLGALSVSEAIPAAAIPDQLTAETLYYEEPASARKISA